MRICIFGAGAIGGFLGAELALAGEDVTLIARGPHLAAMQANGLRLIRDGRERVAEVRCFENAADAGPQDYVVITLKAHSVPGVVDQLAPLFGADTAVVWGVNGVPWWYFHGVEGSWRDRRLESVDPGGVQWNGIRPERALGCVVYPACEVVEPGVVRHIDGDRFTLGEPNGEKSPRAIAFSEALIRAGLKAPVRPRIRDELWVKLWGNMAFNPISALTAATLDRVIADPGTHAICRALMLEGQAVAEKLGVKFPISVDKRIAGGAEVGVHKTSMLQDLERGRPLEIEALLGAVVEMAEWVGVEMPIGRTILALVRQRADNRSHA
jgi:2-dehydropantoate 2-reductase